MGWQAWVRNRRAELEVVSGCGVLTAPVACSRIDGGGVQFTEVREWQFRGKVG